MYVCAPLIDHTLCKRAHINKYIYTYIYLCLFVCVAFMSKFVGDALRLHTYIHTCMDKVSTYRNTFAYKETHIRAHMCIHIYMYRNTYTCLHIHTYKHLKYIEIYITIYVHMYGQHELHEIVSRKLIAIRLITNQTHQQTVFVYNRCTHTYTYTFVSFTYTRT